MEKEIKRHKLWLKLTIVAMVFGAINMIASLGVVKTWVLANNPTAPAAVGIAAYAASCDGKTVLDPCWDKVMEAKTVVVKPLSVYTWNKPPKDIGAVDKVCRTNVQIMKTVPEKAFSYGFERMGEGWRLEAKWKDGRGKTVWTYEHNELEWCTAWNAMYDKAASVRYNNNKLYKAMLDYFPE